MGSVDGPTHTQRDCVESDLSALKLSAQFGYGAFGCSIHEVQLASCLAGVVLFLTTSLRLILRSTPCERGVGGLFGIAGQGVTKIALGRLACV
eukprot:1141022-Pelagomonas_calceolata.AAC.8